MGCGLQALRTTPLAPSAADGASPASSSTGWDKFGAVLYNWDMFIAFSVSAVRAVGPFDPGIYWGKVDYDYYRRIELSGYELYNSKRPEHLLGHPWPRPTVRYHHINQFVYIQMLLSAASPAQPSPIRSDCAVEKSTE